ncbi:MULTISPECIES: NAD-dependent protein deacylase [unclassified Paenibacillus]|uniref:NAD-dependent protein deacylase n=1 Tax=unclassified Paenibacillus TaxID=185978 RepID=UPI00095443EB|nr:MULTISPECIES: NAD-dependent protein deacylase [unclassified Paenibacillus]ASS66257.1 NAD-dependent protein deacylase [Paenibacillus sp. RUD330]SIQ09953.1 NAD-dependent deacetylase [Paenibacillus sp. RU4X]SIQ30516.1 NAD-dependent deacetylase [Paenibacillus sp. RU4T]
MEQADLQTILSDSRRIVFFGGAGTSTESGIPDFRSADGLYEQRTSKTYLPEEILSRDFFMEHPADFYTFYRTHMVYPQALPNAAHRALARLEQEGRLSAVVTQNIDGLHQLAGSRSVLELHGSVHRNDCMDCGLKYPLSAVLRDPRPVPLCTACGGIVKPDVVLYQENLDTDILDRAAFEIEQADTLIVGGTSLTVHPAAGLVSLYRGDKLIIVNRTPTPLDSYANYISDGNVGDVLGSLYPR